MLDMRYLIRAIKYFVAFCVLYVAVLWLSLRMSGMDVSVWDSVMVTPLDAFHLVKFFNGKGRQYAIETLP